MRGDFVQVIYLRNYDGPSDITDPMGEFAMIDVSATNELLGELLADDEDARRKAIERFEADPSRFAPPAFFVVASQLIKSGDTPRGELWLHVGRIRALADAAKCLDPTAHQAVALLNHQFAMDYMLKQSGQYQRLQKATEMAIAWDASHPKKYDQRWIALHGLEAFEKDKLSFEPESQWPQIDAQTRIQSMKGINALVARAKLFDRNNDGALNADEQAAMEGIPIEVPAEVRVKSLCSEELFSSVLDGAGGIRQLDEMHFPNATRRKLVNIEVVIPYGGPRKGVERWAVERDGFGTCFYTVFLVPNKTGGTYILTSEKCEPMKRKKATDKTPPNSARP